MNAELQNSEEWLKLHSVEYMKLTLKDLVDRGKIGKYVEYTGIYLKYACWCPVLLYVFDHIL